ncbi:hypothetical protein ALC56_02860 [Trachymyrmex septentrionalis]|uniref:Uncharacterized protein n=1 Tax=Trachymyrmex septentrionalis TaxID=34720 RepID=A0A151K097_9HYME|nr:hypothetical protein ALC56_02860 [Trachymyrmex septentrionalis]
MNNECYNVDESSGAKMKSIKQYHTVSWVRHRSEEPEPTATVYYWQITQVSNNVRIKAKDMAKVKYPKDNKSMAVPQAA